MERVFYSLLISYSVPFLVIIAIGVFLNQPILRGRFHAWLAGKEGPELIYLKTISEAWAYFEFYFVWLTAFIAITVGNFVLILSALPKIYIDIIRNEKKIMSFIPSRIIRQ